MLLYNWCYAVAQFPLINCYVLEANLDLIEQNRQKLPCIQSTSAYKVIDNCMCLAIKLRLSVLPYSTQVEYVVFCLNWIVEQRLAYHLVY